MASSLPGMVKKYPGNPVINVRNISIISVTAAVKTKHFFTKFIDAYLWKIKATWKHV